MTKTEDDGGNSPTDHEETRNVRFEPDDDINNKNLSTSNSPGGKVRKSGIRKGKRSSKAIDQKTKLERSRQSARECRARKKEKYQLLEEMVEGKEKDVLALRSQLEALKKNLSDGILPKPEDLPATEGPSEEADQQSNR